MEKTGYRTRFSDELYNLFLQRPEIASEDCGTACLEKVYVAVAVNVPEVGVLCPGDGEGEWVVECKVVLDSTRDVLLGLVGHSL